MRDHDRMTNASPPASGIPIAVVGAAVAAGVGFLPGISAFDGPATAGELLSLGWPPLGLVAAVVLDRDPRSRLGRVLVGLAVLPFATFFVALAAEGLSNREIGERLFLSPRTVSTHLYRIYPKVSVSSRAELAWAITSPPPLTKSTSVDNVDCAGKRFPH